MVYKEHEAEWPDKMLFASMLVLLGGLLAVLFDVAVLGGVEVGAEGLVLLAEYPTWLSLTFGILGVVLGAMGVQKQAWAPTLGGAIAVFASMGFLLLAPVLALIALGFILKSFIEHEETKWDEHTVAAELWPDKAIAGSMMLSVAGVVTLIHAIYLYAGSTDALYAVGAPAVQATVNVLIAGFAFWAAREAFHLKNGGIARIASLTCFLGAGFYFLGPVLGIVAFVLLGLAEKEQEFTA